MIENFPRTSSLYKITFMRKNIDMKEAFWNSIMSDGNKEAGIWALIYIDSK